MVLYPGNILVSGHLWFEVRSNKKNVISVFVMGKLVLVIFRSFLFFIFCPLKSFKNILFAFEKEAIGTASMCRRVWFPAVLMICILNRRQQGTSQQLQLPATSNPTHHLYHTAAVIHFL